MRKHRRCIHHPLRGDPPMLPDVTLPASLGALLGALRPCFTAPSYRTFCGLAAGLGRPGRRPPRRGHPRGGPAGRGRKAAGAPGTKVPVAVALVTQLAAAFPGRTVHVVADAAYHGPALKQLPASVTWTTRLPANAVLYALAPPRLPGQRGRPCLKGLRLGTPAELAAAATWTPVTGRIYRRSNRTNLAAIPCLRYACLHTRTVRVILARSDAGVLALVTTDLAIPA